ncbi:MAG TPA: histidine triad nucleotide-binding protein [Rhodocyclaceae bacterium]|jgi:histidine triad (HIT) family protein|nr:histidine triad nucleotide-binding protein [Rhodocyclaceae bacterium]
MSDCIFCKIVEGKIPAKKVYEDKDLLAFHDINPAAPVHVLVIPKLHVETLADCNATHAAMLGNLFVKVGEIAAELGLKDGFRTIVNTGRVGGQEVYHLHAHILGGPQPVGPLLVRH